MKRFNKKLNNTEEVLLLILKALDTWVSMSPYNLAKRMGRPELNYVRKNYPKQHKRSFNKTMNDLKRRAM